MRESKNFVTRGAVSKVILLYEDFTMYYAMSSSKDMATEEKDLEYHRGFLQSVMKKLSNEKFVSNAKPDVIEKERKKPAMRKKRFD